MKFKIISPWLLGYALVQAAPVDTTTLKQISQGFLGQTLQIQSQTLLNSDSNSAPPPITIPPILSARSIAPNVYTVYFVGGGFVTLSMDNIARPILAYSLEGHPPSGEPSEAYDSLITAYSRTIESAKNNSNTDPNIEAMWAELNRFSSTYSPPSLDSSESTPNLGLLFALAQTSPLLSTTWDQGGGWNMYAPTASGGPGGRAYAGCVATSMGQIMNFWKFPSSGVGSRNNINFALTKYAWDSMPNNTYSPAIATLLRHAGAAVDMNYGARGSGAYTYKSAIAYKDYFRYKSTATYLRRIYYSDLVWADTLKKEIDAGRPIQYEGFGTGGHSFVLDAYNSSDYFHFNFGWSGYGNGWYALSNIAPGNMNFTQSQGAVIGIQPGTYTKSPAQTVVGLRANGLAYASGDLSSLSALDPGASYSSRNSALSRFWVADLDGDGHFNDLAGISSTYKLLSIQNYAQNSTWSSLSGNYKSLITYDGNGDGKSDDLAMINTQNILWTQNRGGNLVSTSTKALSVSTGDLNSRGSNQDLIILDPTYLILLSSNQGSTWTRIPIGNLKPRILSTFDMDQNGSNETIQIIDALKNLWIYRDTTWIKIGKNILQAEAVDLDRDGSKDDFLAITSTGAIARSYNLDTLWTLSKITGFKQVLLADIDQDQQNDDLIAINAANTITFFPNGDESKIFKAPMSATQIGLMDLDLNGSLETLISRGTNGALNTSNNFNSIWLANSLDLAVGSFDTVGTMNDIIGIAFDGSLFRSLNGQGWTRIFPPLPALDLTVGDFNRDGIRGDVALVANNGKIYYSSDFEQWDSLKTQGFVKLTVGDFDSDGYEDDLAALGKTYKVYVSNDLDSFILAGNSQKTIMAIDIDGDGKRDDLAGISISNGLRYTENFYTWKPISGTYLYAEVGDFDSDGKMDDIVALNSWGVAYYTTNLSTWNLAGGKGFKSISSADLDGQGKFNDLMAMDASGNLWYSKDRYSWTQIPGMFKFYALGNFSSILNADGALDALQAVKSDPVLNTPVLQNTHPLQVQWQNHQLIFQGLPDGASQLMLYNTLGQTLVQTQIISQNGIAKLYAPYDHAVYGILLDPQQSFHSFQIRTP